MTLISSANELQQPGYPSVDRIEGGWIETRLFRTSAESEIYAVTFGQLATPPFNATTPALYIKDIRSIRTTMRDASGESLVWHVYVTAAPLAAILSGNSDQSILEDKETDSVPEFINDGTTIIAQNLTVRRLYSNKRILTQSDLDLITDESEAKQGKINSAGPFPGATTYEWMCRNVRGYRSGNDLSTIRIEYTYVRAPVDSSGSQMTWKSYGEAQSPQIVYQEADISPYRGA